MELGCPLGCHGSAYGTVSMKCAVGQLSKQEMLYKHTIAILLKPMEMVAISQLVIFFHPCYEHRH